MEKNKYKLLPVSAFVTSMLASGSGFAVPVLPTIDNGEFTLTENDPTTYGMVRVGVDGGTGTLNISGGSLTGQNIYIGTADSTGTVTVSNGGKLNGLNDVRVGFSSGAEVAANGEGTLVVTGAGSAVNTRLLGVGDIAGATDPGSVQSGKMSVLNGATVTTDALILASEATTKAEVVVDGAGSVLTVNGLGTEVTGGDPISVVSGNGNGKVTLSNGGTLAVGGENGINATGGSHQFIFDGGRLQAIGDTVLTSNADMTLQGDGTFDTNGVGITLTGALEGAGGLIKTGAGQLVLAGDSPDYTGQATVNSGELQVNGALASAPVTVNSGATLSGTGSVGDTVINSGGTLRVGAQDNTLSTFTTGSLTNQGTLNIGGNSGQAGNTLKVNGDYAGNGGKLQINSVLGNDSSATDKLLISGNATGNTDVMVTNLGGAGDATINGMEIVNVGGTAAAGAFSNSQQITAGLYDYTVQQKGNNFYLTSDYVAPVAPTPTPTPTPDPEPAEKNITPAAGGYIANLAAANTLFTTRLEDREGGTEYLNPITGEREITSLWLRQEGGHNSFHSGPLKTTSNRYVVQLGGELAHGSFSGNDRWDVGLMTGYANQHGNTSSNLSGRHAKSIIHGYSAGLYGTWYQNAQDKNGLYVDSWVLYNRFSASVENNNSASDSYHLDGVSGSLESGYTFNVYRSERLGGYLQPQAQLTWSGIRADGHRDDNGTRISGEGNGNLMSRLGVRAYLKGHSRLDDHTGRSFKPYVEANWIHNTERYGVKMDGDSLSQDGAKNIAEVKTGVDGQLTSNLNMWGGVGVQVGDNSYNDTAVQLGVKYKF